jgi:putative transposase
VLISDDLAVWFERLRLSEATRSLIRQIRSSNPSRVVGGGRRNVTGRYPSRKMGVTIQFESHRVELAAIYELEYDSNVLEYYDQPGSITLEYPSAGGRKLVVRHTPDYFVLRSDGAGWEECKTEEDLIRLSGKNPNRYALREGIWHCPPGQAFAKQFGLSYRVFSSASIDWIHQRNILFLEDYLKSGTAPVDSRACEFLLAQVSADPGISLNHLMSRATPTATPDNIYALIATGVLYVNLSRAALAEPERVSVFPDQKVAAATNHIVEASRSRLHSIDSDAVPLDCLAQANELDLREANRRHAIVKEFLNGGFKQTDCPISLRTVQRWAYDYRQAELQGRSGYIGLLPRSRQRGNRQPRLPDSTKSLMADFIRKDYENPKQKTRYASWIALKRECEARSLMAPSYESFRVAVNRSGGYEQIVRRQGHRAAYSREPFYWHLQMTTPRHGDRPFEIAHLDHTELDVELLSSVTKRNLNRPWLSLLVDAFSRRVLAFYLCFDPPSYRSCMMVIRECVARHARLPQTFVVDGGPEFGSTYFEALLARYECVKKTRPPSKARFGSVCERLFGTCNTQFVHNLIGNTQIMTSVRIVTRSVNPKNHATWCLPSLQQKLEEYFYGIYDNLEHPALGQSPREAFEAGLLQSGQRGHRSITYDRAFMIGTMPTTSKGTARVIPGKGVQIHSIYYWSDLFRDPDVERSQVPVRYDPSDAGIAYAFVSNQWVECHSEYFVIFQGHSEREMRMASEELRRRNQQHSRARDITAKTLGEFLQSVETDEAVFAQRLRDQEVRAAWPTQRHGSAEREAEVARLQQEAADENRPIIPPVSAGEELITYGDF